MSCTWAASAVPAARCWNVCWAVAGWANVGELVDLPRSVAVNDERCGCGEPLHECPFWSAVGDLALRRLGRRRVRRLAELRTVVARQRQVPPCCCAGARRPGGRATAALVREYQEGYGAIYRAVGERQRCSTVVDASKGPAHGVALGAGGPGVADRASPSRSSTWCGTRVAVAYSWSRRSITRTQAIGGAAEDMWRLGRALGGPVVALQAEIELVRSRGRACARAG